MRVICHIGHHKTGTTSLQAYLSQNAGALLRTGILYPWVESQGAALSIAQARSATWSWKVRARKIYEATARRTQHSDRQQINPINFREAHNALAFRMLADNQDNWRVPDYHSQLPHSRQMLLAIRNQIATLRPREVILCSEVMSHFGLANPQLITQLRQALSQAKDFTLWCTLRRPDEQAASWYGQQIKFGQAPRALSDPDGVDFDWLHFNYRRVIEPWLERVPEARLVLRPYRDVMAEGGSVEDLHKHSGIRFPRGLLTAPVMNVSLSPGVTALRCAANRALPRPLAKEFGSQIITLAQDIAQPAAKEVELFGKANRQLMRERFEPIHQYLSQIGNRPTFFENLDEMLVCKPVTEAEALRQLLDGLSGRQSQLTRPELRDFLDQQINQSGSRKAAAGQA